VIAPTPSTHKKSYAFETDLHKLYPKVWLMQLAKKMKFIKRERKIKSDIIFWSLALGFSDRSQRTIAGFKRLYEKEANTSLSDSSWYDRFTPEFVEFLHKCVIHGIEELEKEPGRKLSEKLGKFKDILIQDSTIVRLHDSLANKFPATRARKIAAGVKVGVMISAIANGPKTVALYSENTAEIKTLRIGPWIRDRILLVDLGFFKTQLFTRVEENGGYFVSRIRKNMDPFIVSIESGILEEKREGFIGKRVSELTEQLSGKDLDAVVKIAFKRRAYKGKQRKDEMHVRLVATYNCEEEKYHIYITNIKKDVLDVNDIAKLYGARWEIELLFKELKSGYALDGERRKSRQLSHL
jgi:putative transposase